VASMNLGYWPCSNRCPGIEGHQDRVLARLDIVDDIPFLGVQGFHDAGRNDDVPTCFSLADCKRFVGWLHGEADLRVNI